MNEQQAFDFLDVLAIFTAGLQLDEHINSVTRADIMVLNQKLDRLISIVSNNNKDVDKRP